MPQSSQTLNPYVNKGYYNGYYSMSYFYNDAGPNAVALQVVPEPQSWAMLACGVGVLRSLQIRHRRQKLV